MWVRGARGGPMDLTYRSFARVLELGLDECTIRRARVMDGSRVWWHIWFHVTRETDGVPDFFCVPISPNGVYTESGPGGRTWGLQPAGDGIWQVSPSIDVLDDLAVRAEREGKPRPPESKSLWHKTPRVVGVPDGEAWISQAP